MVQWQKTQRFPIWGKRSQALGRLHIADHIPVRDHYPFRDAGGSRSIKYREHIIGPNALFNCSYLFTVIPVLAKIEQFGKMIYLLYLVKAVNKFHIRDLRIYLHQFFVDIFRRKENRFYFRFIQDELQVVQIYCRIDGNSDHIDLMAPEINEIP